MASKKLVNDPLNVVDEMVEGVVTSNPSLKRLSKHRVILRADVEEVRASKVTLISGGGSGHEPAHAGYVGKGMLTAAVLGGVFASPDVESIHAAIKAVGSKNGVLLIIKNYTGDRLNFGLAAEKAKVEGIPVNMVVVGEDCALLKNKQGAGRRGLAGTVFVHKVAGACAEAGMSLDEVTARAQAVADSVGTMGVGLSGCTVPGAAPAFSLKDDEMELGLGIHGEAGIERTKISNVDKVVETLIDTILSKDENRNYLPWEKNDNFALMINNLGGTPMMECHIAARHALNYLASKGVKVSRSFVGYYMTALEMAGLSITLLKLSEDTLSSLDAPASTPGWGATPPQGLNSLEAATIASPDVSQRAFAKPSSLSSLGTTLQKAIEAAAKKVSSDEVEKELTKLDGVSGDGDCGQTLQRGALHILDKLATSFPLNDGADVLEALSQCVHTMGGSSGALYSIFFEGARADLTAGDASDPKHWAKAFKAGLDAIMTYGGAKVGHRTMIDALYPAVESLEKSLASGSDPKSALAEAATAAEGGAASTAQLEAGAGRASYVNQDLIQGHADPGAVAVAIWIRAVADALK